MSDERRLELLYECDGCVANDPNAHTGTYTQIMDWAESRPIPFKDLAR